MNYLGSFSESSISADPRGPGTERASLQLLEPIDALGQTLRLSAKAREGGARAGARGQSPAFRREHPARPRARGQSPTLEFPRNDVPTLGSGRGGVPKLGRR